jgi:lysophospholipase L1-like esterase
MNRIARAAAIVVSFAVVFAVSAAGAKPAAAPPAKWVASWASSQMIPDSANALAADDLRDATLRQTVHLSLGGKKIRVRLSNAFGIQPLHLTQVHVARAAASGSAAIDPASDRALAFDGKADVIVPPGAEYWSDSLDFEAPDKADLAISIHYADPPAQQTSHPGSRTTSYLVHGDHTGDADLAGAKTCDHWYQISGLDVVAPGRAFAIVTLGDSITDGRGSTTNGNDRWPDLLAARLLASAKVRPVAVVNAGIGGNRLLDDGLGPNALSRFDRDVLGISGVRALIVLEGINDLGSFTRLAPATPAEHTAMANRVIGALRQIAARARAHGIKAIGATVLPDGGSDYYHPDAANEADRQAVNAWIRAKGHFDAVADFDAALRDPGQPDRLRPDCDSGDHLHPSPAGYRAMAEAIPVAIFGE